MVKDLPASAGDIGDVGSVPGLGGSLGGGNGNPLVFLPAIFHGQRSLGRYSPWGCKQSDTTTQLSTHAHVSVCVCIYTSLQKIIHRSTFSNRFNI